MQTKFRLEKEAWRTQSICAHHLDCCLWILQQRVKEQDCVRNVHEANAGEICQECNKVFNKKALLGAHIRNVHESADDLFCHVCGSQCKNLNALKKHVKKCDEKPKRAQKHFVPGNRVGDAEFGNDTTMTRCVIGRTSTTSHSGCTTIRRILTIRFLAGYAEQVVRNRDMNRQHYMNKHNILDKEVLKNLSLL